MPDLPRRRRPQRPSWTQPIVERLTPAIRVLVIIEAVVFLFYSAVTAARPAMDAHLALGPGFLTGQFWQPLTALFLPRDGWTFVFDLIGLWFVGAMLEKVQGTRRFVTMFFTAGVLANLTIGVLQMFTPVGLFGGNSFAVLALFVAMGRLYGRQPMQVLGSLFLQARVLALIFVVWALLAYAWGRSWPHVAATVVAVAVGYLASAPKGLRELYDMMRARTLRRRYRVLEGGASRRARSPKYWN